MKLESGWTSSLLLLLIISFVPFIIPMADAIPSSVRALAQEPAARQHNRVVLIIVDGLGYRKATERGLMPYLQARIKRSAFGVGLASFPSITPMGLRAIMSGHGMVSQPEMPTGIYTSPEKDSILARAVAGGLKAFVIGQFTWEPLFPRGHGAELTIVPYKAIETHMEHGVMESDSHYDAEVLDAAEPILRGRKGKWDLLVLHLFESDPIGHLTGTETTIYHKHLRWVDRAVEKLSARLQAQEPTTFMMLADHGQAADGTHGSLSKDHRQVPFLLWGAGINPAELGEFPLYNSAPTLAALLRVPPPALTEGWPMLGALKMTPREKTEILMDLWRQRLDKWAAVKAAYPWLTGDPAAQYGEVARLYRAKSYAASAAQAEWHLRIMDIAIQDALPAKWLWRLIAALWFLVLAAVFGMAWPQAEAPAARVTAVLGILCLLLLEGSLLRPGIWSWASGAVLLVAACVMILAVLPGFRGPSQLDHYGWALLTFAIFSIAFQDIFDMALWSWLVVLGLFIGRALHLTPENRLTSMFSFLALLVCALWACVMPSTEGSLVRSLLPDVRSLNALGLIQHVREPIVLAFILLASCLPILHSADNRRRAGVYYTLMMAPVAIASLVMMIKPAAAPWVWGLCALSLGGFVLLSPPTELRGMWLSAVTLAYFRTMAQGMEWPFLALTVAVGWGLAWKSRDGHPLWEGIGLLGFGLWSFQLTGGRLTFSHISVADGERILGAGWHPFAIMALLILKYLAAIGAPVLPRMAIRPLSSVMGIFPLIGALAAGNLSMLWWSRFMQGANMKFTDETGFTRTIFVLLLGWVFLGLWSAVRGLDFLSEKMASRRA